MFVFFRTLATKIAYSAMIAVDQMLLKCQLQFSISQCFTCASCVFRLRFRQNGYMLCVFVRPVDSQSTVYVCIHLFIHLFIYDSQTSSIKSFTQIRPTKLFLNACIWPVTSKICSLVRLTFLAIYIHSLLYFNFSFLFVSDVLLLIELTLSQLLIHIR